MELKPQPHTQTSLLFMEEGVLRWVVFCSQNGWACLTIPVQPFSIRFVFQVAKLENKMSELNLELTIVHEPTPFFQWVMSTKVIAVDSKEEKQGKDYMMLAIGFGGNSVSIVEAVKHNEATSFHTIYSIDSTPETMLYSMSIQTSAFSTTQDLLIASGTMFGTALVWSVNAKESLEAHDSGKPLLSLQGHQGAILRQEVSQNCEKVASHGLWKNQQFWYLLHQSFQQIVV